MHASSLWAGTSRATLYVCSARKEWAAWYTFLSPSIAALKELSMLQQSANNWAVVACLEHPCVVLLSYFPWAVRTQQMIRGFYDNAARRKAEHRAPRDVRARSEKRPFALPKLTKLPGFEAYTPCLLPLWQQL